MLELSLRWKSPLLLKMHATTSTVADVADIAVAVAICSSQAAAKTANKIGVKTLLICLAHDDVKNEKNDSSADAPLNQSADAMPVLDCRCASSSSAVANDSVAHNTRATCIAMR